MDEMEGEIQRFIKVWITTISCLCYCYYISSKIPKGFFRLLSLLPILYLFLILPFNLSSVHLRGPTTFFLVWLATFKLLLFSFNQGPLSSTPNIFHFISIASLPIIPKQHATKNNTNPPHQSTPNIEKPKKEHDFPSLPIVPNKHPTKNNTTPPHQSTSNIEKPKKEHFFPLLPKSLLLFPKVLILAMIIRAYDYRDNLHPYLILVLYCINTYLGIELVLAICAYPVRTIFGFEIEPQFNEPYLCTSLQDFWGRRWNLMVTNILRPTVYDPIRSMCTYFVGPSSCGTSIATLATFLVSGIMHELIYYYLARAPPTWEVTWFFVLNGVCTAVEVAAKKVLVRRGWWLPRGVSGILTLVFLMVTGKWLFFPQLLRNGVVDKAIGEYAIMVDFVKSKL